MAKKISGYIKLHVPAGKATPDTAQAVHRLVSEIARGVRS